MIAIKPTTTGGVGGTYSFTGLQPGLYFLEGGAFLCSVQVGTVNNRPDGNLGFKSSIPWIEDIYLGANQAGVNYDFNYFPNKGLLG